LNTFGKFQGWSKQRPLLVLKFKQKTDFINALLRLE